MNLKSIRISKGLSIPALSKISGVPVRTIEDFEKRGDGRISTALKLSSALNITLDELCKEEPED